jgi:hypothetical protein
MRYSYILAVLLLTWSLPAAQGGWLDWLLPRQGQHFAPSYCPPQCGCPDDYCKKPVPCIPCLPRCGGPDDYCKKPWPFVPCLPRCGGPDDYCKKPLPYLLCPGWSPFLNCGIPEPCGGNGCVGCPK